MNVKLSKQQKIQVLNSPDLHKVMQQVFTRLLKAEEKAAKAMAELKNKAIEIAKKMLAKNKPVKENIEFTGLSKKEVEGLRK